MSNNQGIEKEVLDRFEVIKKVGSGAYGYVWKVRHKESQKILALKKIFQAFQHATDAQRTFREISILKKISHSSIVKLHDVFLAQNEKDVYLTFEFMETDLYHAIYEGILEDVHKKFTMYQVITALKYIHEKGLIHRDLKPSNILLSAECEAKICDFGLARLINCKRGESSTMTEGVATRWYRAPQVLLNSDSYGQSADVWSLGCIMAELLIKNPMFPGSSTPNQLQKILQFTGKPTGSDVESIKCTFAESIIEQCGSVKKRSANEIFGYSDPVLVDLICKILQFNPQKRPSMTEILQHKYFEGFYNQKDTTNDICDPIQLQVDENIKLTAEGYIKLLRRILNQQRKVSLTPPKVRKTSNSRVLAFSPLRQRESENKRVVDQMKKCKQAVEMPIPNKSPQRVNLAKVNQPSFSKLLDSDKRKKRCDSKDASLGSSSKRNLNLFTEVLEKKRQESRSKSRVRNTDKQNVQGNMLHQELNWKKFELSSASKSSRVSFQGLKKSSAIGVKFNQKRV